MTEYCIRCQKLHDDYQWKGSYDKNIKKVVYICSQHYKTTANEFVPDRIVQDRKDNAKSMIQPWREGEASAEYIEAYPEQAKNMFTTRERLTAKNVWKDTIPSYWRRTR